MRNAIRLVAVVAVLVSAGLVGTGAASASSKTIIANGGFSMPSSHGSAFSPGVGTFQSCIKHWQLVQTQAGTQVFCDHDSPSTAPGGGRGMVYLRTSGTGCGLAQSIGPKHGGLEGVSFSVWLWVISGSVNAETTANGSITGGAATGTTDTWVNLITIPADGSSNGVLIEGLGSGAIFFIDEASASST